MEPPPPKRPRAATVVDAVLHGLDGEGEPFQPAKAFAGARRGYVFKAGARGVGYYADGLGGAHTSSARAVAPHEPNGASAAPERPAADPLSLLEAAEAAAEAAGGAAVEVVDAKAVRRLVLSFEKRLRDNLAARTKHAATPDKFVDSEVELHDAVQALTAIAAAPDCYPELVRLGAVPSLLGLLAHDNADMAAAAVALLRELTDDDALAADGDARHGAALVESLIAAGGLPQLARSLSRFDPAVPEEASALQAACSLLENIVELTPAAADAVGAAPGLLPWLLARLQSRGADATKLQASELLAVLLQVSPANRSAVVAAGGMDALLTSASHYKSRDAADGDEAELAENVFGAVAATLLAPEAPRAFLDSEGVELMLLIIKAGCTSRTAALRVLDTAVSRCPDACARLVECGGLKTAFAVFMAKGAVMPSGKRRTRDALRAEEEHAIAITAQLFQGLGRGGHRDRLAAKFVESGYEKCDRLAEVFFAYRDRDAAQVAKALKRGGDDGEDGDDDDDDAAYAARLEAGLFTLQQVALTMAHLWAVGHEGIRERLLLLLEQRGAGLADVRTVIAQHAAAIGDDQGAEAQGERRARALELAAGLRLPWEGEGANGAGPTTDAGEPGAADEADKRESKEYNS